MSAAITTPLNWGHRDPAREASVRRESAALIAGVLDSTAGMPDIDVSLALGAACPFSGRRDRDLWLEEIHRLQGAS